MEESLNGFNLSKLNAEIGKVNEVVGMDLLTSELRVFEPLVDDKLHYQVVVSVIDENGDKVETVKSDFLVSDTDAEYGFDDIYDKLIMHFHLVKASDIGIVQGPYAGKNLKELIEEGEMVVHEPEILP